MSIDFQTIIDVVVDVILPLFGSVIKFLAPLAEWVIEAISSAM